MPGYDRIGRGYSRTRRPDPRIARYILGALGNAGSVVNVGAGAGSYEPEGAHVVAVEPSREMVAQRVSAAAVRWAGVAVASSVLTVGMCGRCWASSTPAKAVVTAIRLGTLTSPEPGSKQLRPPTPRQLARWKAIQQAQLQWLSMRATARLLGIAGDTVSSYVRANGVPGRRNGAAASSQGRDRTDKVAALLD